MAEQVTITGGIADVIKNITGPDSPEGMDELSAKNCIDCDKGIIRFGIANAMDIYRARTARTALS